MGPPARPSSGPPSGAGPAAGRGRRHRFPQHTEAVQLVPQKHPVAGITVGENGLFDLIRAVSHLHQGQGVVVVQPFIGFVHNRSSQYVGEYSIQEKIHVVNTVLEFFLASY